MHSQKDSRSNHNAALSSTMERLPVVPHKWSCAYAFVPSRDWFIGFITLLQSLTTNSDANDEACGYLFLGHPELPDSQLNASETHLVHRLLEKRQMHWHTIHSGRLALWKQVPNLRPGAMMSFAKMDVFFDKGPHSIVFFDLDMLVLKPVGFVHTEISRLTARNKTDWAIHGSANFYGVSGWVHPYDTTDLSLMLNPYLNGGWFAFHAPVPASFLSLMEERLHNRIRDNTRTFSADQDVINYALRKHPKQRHIHTDWHTNYRPNSEAALAHWRAVHWMGVPKPWGKVGHTTAPVRYNDRTIKLLDARWLDACRGAVAAVKAPAALAEQCATQPNRVVPGPVPFDFLVLVALGLLLLAVGVKKRLHSRGWVFLAALWLTVLYVDADWDHSPIRRILGLA